MNTYKMRLEDNAKEYRCFVGNSKIIFVKAEMATYLEIGRRLHRLYGCSVIFVLGFGSTDADKRIIEDFIARNNIVDAQLFYVSHAMGCFDGLELASGGVLFKKMVLVNMPITDVLERTMGRFMAIPNSRVVVIFAERDRSFECVPLLKEKGMLNVEIFLSRDIYHSRKIAIDAFKEFG